MLSKHPLMSASKIHVLDPRWLRVVWMAVMACTLFLPGRKPYELASKRHSHSGSSASLMVACITRSLGGQDAERTHRFGSLWGSDRALRASVGNPSR